MWAHEWHHIVCYIIRDLKLDCLPALVFLLMVQHRGHTCLHLSASMFCCWCACTVLFQLNFIQSSAFTVPILALIFYFSHHSKYSNSRQQITTIIWVAVFSSHPYSCPTNQEQGSVVNHDFSLFSALWKLNWSEDLNTYQHNLKWQTTYFKFGSCPTWHHWEEGVNDQYCSLILLHFWGAASLYTVSGFSCFG